MPFNSPMLKFVLVGFIEHKWESTSNVSTIMLHESEKMIEIADIRHEGQGYTHDRCNGHLTHSMSVSLFKLDPTNITSHETRERLPQVNLNIELLVKSSIIFLKYINLDKSYAFCSVYCFMVRITNHGNDTF
jgi:hypothetical protein